MEHGFDKFKIVNGMQRREREPAPLLCEGACMDVTIHFFSRVARIRKSASDLVAHDVYRCSECQTERVWG